MGLDPEMRGLAISNSDQIRDVHNSFARQGKAVLWRTRISKRSSLNMAVTQLALNPAETFSVEGKTASDDDDIYHFIAYVPHNGRVYELDGIQSAPIDHGQTGGLICWTAIRVAFSFNFADFCRFIRPHRALRK